MHAPGGARASTYDGAHIRTPSGNSIHSFHVLPNLDAPLRRRPLREKLALYSIIDTRCGRTVLGLTIAIFCLVAAAIITFATTPLDGTLVTGDVWDEDIFEGRLILTTDGSIGSGIGIGGGEEAEEASLVNTLSPTMFNETLSPTMFNETLSPTMFNETDEFNETLSPTFTPTLTPTLFDDDGDIDDSDGMLFMTTCEVADITKFVAQPISAATCIAYFFVSVMMLAFAAADSCWSGVYNIEDSLLLRRPAWSLLLALPMFVLSITGFFLHASVTVLALRVDLAAWWLVGVSFCVFAFFRLVASFLVVESSLVVEDMQRMNRTLSERRSGNPLFGEEEQDRDDNMSDSSHGGEYSRHPASIRSLPRMSSKRLLTRGSEVGLSRRMADGEGEQEEGEGTGDALTPTMQRPGESHTRTIVRTDAGCVFGVCGIRATCRFGGRLGGMLADFLGFCLLVAAGAGCYLFATHVHYELRQESISVLLALLFFFFTTVHWCFHRRLILASWSVLATGLLLAAAGFGLYLYEARPQLCDPLSPFQAHGLWHVLSAMGLFCVYLFFRGDEVSPPDAYRDADMEDRLLIVVKGNAGGKSVATTTLHGDGDSSDDLDEAGTMQSGGLRGRAASDTRSVSSIRQLKRRQQGTDGMRSGLSATASLSTFSGGGSSVGSANNEAGRGATAMLQPRHTSDHPGAGSTSAAMVMRSNSSAAQDTITVSIIPAAGSSREEQQPEPTPPVRTAISTHPLLNPQHEELEELSLAIAVEEVEEEEPTPHVPEISDNRSITSESARSLPVIIELHGDEHDERTIGNSAGGGRLSMRSMPTTTGNSRPFEPPSPSAISAYAAGLGSSSSVASLGSRMSRQRTNSMNSSAAIAAAVAAAQASDSDSEDEYEESVWSDDNGSRMSMSRSQSSRRTSRRSNFEGKYESENEVSGRKERHRMRKESTLVGECTLCGLPVHERERTQDAFGKLWHGGCLKCNVCFRDLSNDVAVVKPSPNGDHNTTSCEEHANEDGSQTARRGHGVIVRGASASSLGHRDSQRLSASVSERRQEIQERMASQVGDAPTCNRCGGELNDGLDVIVNGMERYHRVCPEVTSLFRVPRHYARRSPGLIAVGFSCDASTGKTYTFLFALDTLTKERALRNHRKDPATLGYEPDTMARAKVRRKLHVPAEENMQFKITEQTGVFRAKGGRLNEPWFNPTTKNVVAKLFHVEGGVRQTLTVWVRFNVEEKYIEAVSAQIDIRMLPYKEGTAVTAKIPGWRTYYSGTVQGVNEDDGTYSVQFDDGEVVDRIKQHQIKATRRIVPRI